jgi:hypothetical protein
MLLKLPGKYDFANFWTSCNRLDWLGYVSFKNPKKVKA